MANKNHCISFTRVPIVYQTWQDGNLPLRAPAHKVTSLFDYVVLRDYVTSYNFYISGATVLMATKYRRMVTYVEGS